jgi:hypothetical protein
MSLLTSAETRKASAGILTIVSKNFQPLTRTPKKLSGWSLIKTGYLGISLSLSLVLSVLNKNILSKASPNATFYVLGDGLSYIKFSNYFIIVSLSMAVNYSTPHCYMLWFNGSGHDDALEVQQD